MAKKTFEELKKKHKVCLEDDKLFDFLHHEAKIRKFKKYNGGVREDICKMISDDIQREFMLKNPDDKSIIEKTQNIIDFIYDVREKNLSLDKKENVDFDKELDMLKEKYGVELSNLDLKKIIPYECEHRKSIMNGTSNKKCIVSSMLRDNIMKRLNKHYGAENVKKEQVHSIYDLLHMLKSLHILKPIKMNSKRPHVRIIC